MVVELEGQKDRETDSSTSPLMTNQRPSVNPATNARPSFVVPHSFRCHVTSGTLLSSANYDLLVLAGRQR